MQHGLHRRRFGDQLGHALAAEQRVLGLEQLPLAERLAQFDLGPDDGQQPRVVPRLLDEVARAAPHGLDGHFDAAPGGHDHDGKRRVDRLDAGEKIQAFFARRRVTRVIEIDERDIEIASLDGREHAGRGRRRFEDEALCLQQKAQRFEDVRLIVRDQYPGFGRPRGVALVRRSIAALFLEMVRYEHDAEAFSCQLSAVSRWSGLTAES